jgi:hypothetical protein
MIDLRDYKKVRKLGRGSVNVWLAENQKKEALAVRYIGDSPVCDMSVLRRELEATTKLNHPCLVRNVGWSLPTEEHPSVRIAMEFIENGSVEGALLRVKNGETPPFWNHTNIVHASV